MATENINNTSETVQPEVGSDEKVSVGSFSFRLSPGALARITDQIGPIIEAQIILRGEKQLGYGPASFSVEGGEGSADISGTARLSADNAGKKKSNKSKSKKNGRARRSADDQLDPTSEEAAASGATSVKAVTDGMNRANLNENGAAAGSEQEVSAAGGAVEKAAIDAVNAGTGGRGMRGAKRGRGARGTATARAPRQRRERGEPSKTLVYIRNIPFAFTEDNLTSVLSTASVSYKSVSLPAHKYGLHKGQGRGFAFITVESEADQTKIIEALDGKTINASGEMVAPAPVPAEGEEAPAPVEGAERKFKLHVRQGYEQDEQEESKEGAAATGETETEAAQEQPQVEN